MSASSAKELVRETDFINQDLAAIVANTFKQLLGLFDET